MAQQPERVTGEVRRRKPLLSTSQILLMDLGFFGVWYSFGMEQTAVNPLFGFLHVDPVWLPLLNFAGSLTNIFFQPLLGVASDGTWHERFGRRRPFFVIGAVGAGICLFLFPFSAFVWMAVILMWLLDTTNHTTIESYRAFIADKAPSSQLIRSFLTAAAFSGFGVALANFSMWFFKQVIVGTFASGIPYFMLAAFALGAICVIGSIIVAAVSTPELPPSAARGTLLENREKFSPRMAVKEYAHAVKDMPAGMHVVGAFYIFQWFAFFVFWQYETFSVAKSVYHTTEANPALYANAVALTGLLNVAYNVFAILFALPLIALARRIGAKWVHSLCLCAAGLCLFFLFPHISNPILIFVPTIGLGLAWAGMMSVPMILVASMVPAERMGIYFGIVNTMQVTPTLVESVLFGFVYGHFLGGDPEHAIMFAGAFFVIGGLIVPFVRVGRPEEQSDHLPLSGRHMRHLKVAQVLDMPMAAAVEILRQGPQRWLPDFTMLAGAPITVLHVEEGGLHLPIEVQVDLGALVQVDGTAQLPIQWEAVEHPWLYPRVLGFIRVQDNHGRAELRFDARYVPPGGRLGWTLDRLMLGQVGRATLRDFFVRMSDRITHGPDPEISIPEGRPTTDALGGQAPA